MDSRYGSVALLRSVSRAPKGMLRQAKAGSALSFGEVWLAIRSCRACEVAKYGQGWIRTSEGVSQQIYSLPRLAASVPTRNEGFRGSPFAILGLRFHTALNS